MVNTPVQKCPVVRNQNEPLFCIEIIADSFTGLHIKMICRLVNQKEMIALQKQRGQQDLGLFTVAQRFKGTVQHIL